MDKTEVSFEMVNSATCDSLSGELDTDDVAETNRVQIDDIVVRKIVRKQKLDRKEYVASELAQILRQRKAKNGRAKYWDLLSVDIETVDEEIEDEIRRYEKVVVRCLRCGSKHDSSNLNVPNFSSSHFKMAGTELQCKNFAKQGAPL
jgi:hypothetical protein